jgi:AraC-like DNA-binding protein
MNNIINPILAGSLLLLIFLSLTNPNGVNVKANRWFGVFIVCIFFVVFDEIYLTIQKEKISGLISIISNSVAFYIAPVFYLSISYFINPNRIWKFKENLHFLFGIVCFIVTICDFVSKDTTNGLTNNNTQLVSVITILYNIFYALFSIQILIYGYFTFIKLKKHQKDIKLYISNTEIIDLKWLSNIVITVVFLFIIWVVDMQFEFSTDDFLLINLLLLVEIFFIGYHFIKQKEIYPFSENQTNEIIEIIEEYESIDSKKQLIDDDKLQESKIELSKLMTSKKLFLDPEISLVKLATEMVCTPHTLSYIINNGYNENFFQFINRYRIEEAKRMILDPKNNYLSLLGIGFEVGFNSKSAYNSTFKKVSGQTPSEFKKSNILE